MDPVLVIMAAGMGSRFGGLKQMTSVDDEEQVILDYSAYDALTAGFRKIVCDCSRSAPVSEIVGNIVMSVIRAGALEQ